MHEMNENMIIALDINKKDSNDIIKAMREYNEIELFVDLKEMEDSYLYESPFYEIYCEYMEQVARIALGKKREHYDFVDFWGLCYGSMEIIYEDGRLRGYFNFELGKHDKFPCMDKMDNWENIFREMEEYSVDNMSNYKKPIMLVMCYMFDYSQEEVKEEFIRALEFFEASDERKALLINDIILETQKSLMPNED